jgi:hypothetical protein
VGSGAITGCGAVGAGAGFDATAAAAGPGVLSGFVSIFFGAFATLFSLGATTASAS